MKNKVSKFAFKFNLYRYSEAREVGMDGALGKPCRPETTRETLKTVLAGKFQRGTFKTSSKRANLHF